MRDRARTMVQTEITSPRSDAALIDSAVAPSAASARARMFAGEAPAWLQVAPFAAVFLIFFLVPLALTVMVSFWDYTEYEIVPAFTLRSYVETFEGCFDRLPDLCVTLKTYLSTLKFCLIVWLVTLVIGFCVAYFLSFHVRSTTMQIALFLVCTIPFWTSNIIRTISWIPLLGRNGLFNSTLVKLGLINEPIEWLIFSDFSVIMSLVHLYTLFMIVPIFNSMMRIDRALLEAAYDAGASGWQALWNVVIPLSKPGIVIGSIFVITIVMGDFVTVGVMGGQQIASVGKVINTEMTALQFPPAAANSVILLIAVLFIIWALTRLVDIRKEL
jgi:putative spermidine/putrescine transport system permease protein